MRTSTLEPIEQQSPDAPARLSPIETIALLEDTGYLRPRCAACAATYKDAVVVAQRLSADPTWRPATSHAPSPRCEGTGRPHCLCGPCTGAEGSR